MAILLYGIIAIAGLELLIFVGIACLWIHLCKFSDRVNILDENLRKVSQENNLIRGDINKLVKLANKMLDVDQYLGKSVDKVEKQASELLRKQDELMADFHDMQESYSDLYELLETEFTKEEVSAFEKPA